ncbi:hypothetical protein HZD82_22560, partial [Pantoea agglomerans]|nr:hypothetical protein [Pantoea agglomerans]
PFSAGSLLHNRPILLREPAPAPALFPDVATRPERQRSAGNNYDAHNKIARLGNEGMYASAKLVTKDQIVLVNWHAQQEQTG